MADTVFASREGTSPGPEHRQWLPLPPAAPTSHLGVVWGHLGSLALHPSLIPVEEMLAYTFWAEEDMHWSQSSKRCLGWRGSHVCSVFTRLHGFLSTGAFRWCPPPDWNP